MHDDEVGDGELTELNKQIKDTDIEGGGGGNQGLAAEVSVKKGHEKPRGSLES